MKMQKVVDCRLELLTMIDTIAIAKDISMDNYYHFFSNSSSGLKKMLFDLGKHSAAWDVFAMCLNYVGWTLEDYEILILVTKRFMNNVRLGVLEEK